MNRERLIESIKAHEGYQAEPYYCPAGALTVGWGHNLEEDETIKGDSYALVYREMFDPRSHEVWLNEDVEFASTDAVFYLADGVPLSAEAIEPWEMLTDLRREVLVEMAFQMGGPALSKFKQTREYILAGDYDAAADEMLRGSNPDEPSAWAKQTPERAKTLADRFRQG